jgi:hypothetical protein
LRFLLFPPFRKVRERMGHPEFVVVLCEGLIIKG